MEQAIELVMKIYNVDREIAVKYFWDEIEACMSLIVKGVIEREE